jgi:hypothetical protein
MAARTATVSLMACLGGPRVPADEAARLAETVDLAAVLTMGRVLKQVLGADAAPPGRTMRAAAVAARLAPNAVRRRGPAALRRYRRAVPDPDRRKAPGSTRSRSARCTPA